MRQLAVEQANTEELVSLVEGGVRLGGISRHAMAMLCLRAGVKARYVGGTYVVRVSDLPRLRAVLDGERAPVPA